MAEISSPTPHADAHHLSPVQLPGDRQLVLRVMPMPADANGNGKHHLVPSFQPATDGSYQSARRKNSTSTGTKTSPVTKGRILTQHTGLPPRKTK